MGRFLYPACEVELTVLLLTAQRTVVNRKCMGPNGNFMRPLWTQPLYTSASIPLDYASKGYVDGVLAIPDVIVLFVF